MGLFGKPQETKPAMPVERPKPEPPRAAPAQHTPRKPCVIGSKTTITGEIAGDEDVLVEGTVEGQVRISQNLTVGSGGVVRATVEADSVVVAGELVGDCTVSKRMEIQSTGRLTGDIRAPRIVIAEGAVFKGNSDMSSSGAAGPAAPRPSKAP